MLGLLENSSTGDLEQGAFSPNGCLTSKSNSADSSQNVTYTWSDEDRLTRVQGPGSLDVSFSYDSMGRMLTRTSGTTVTRFSWDGWDCVGESTSVSGTMTSTTTYVIPQGQLLSFTRDGVTYQVHSDALSSVRMVTDPSGNVVFRAEYDAWGNALSVTDNVPGGMPYRYVGKRGVRWDADLGLYYMRKRWFVKDLQRWTSRDPLRSTNRYQYCNNKPTKLTDSSGLQPGLDSAVQTQAVMHQPCSPPPPCKKERDWGDAVPQVGLPFPIVNPMAPWPMIVRIGVTTVPITTIATKSLIRCLLTPRNDGPQPPLPPGHWIDGVYEQDISPLPVVPYNNDHP